MRWSVFVLVAVCPLAAERIHLKTKTLETREDLEDYRVGPLKRRRPGRSHYLLQFEGKPGLDQIGELERRGATVTSRIPGSAVMVSAGDDLAFDDLGLRWAGRLRDEDKVSPSIAELTAGEDSGAFIVEFHTDIDLEESRKMVFESSLEILDNPDLLRNQLLVKGPFEKVSRLAEWDEVAYIFPASPDLVFGFRTEACAGALIGDSLVGQFAKVSQGWPAGPNGVQLIYFFGHLTGNLPRSTAESEILRGFREWAKYANLHFIPGYEANTPNTISVQFFRGAHGDPYPFDGPGKILAHTFYPSNPEPIAGDIHLDDEEPWQVGARVDLFTVALHETGHALGLGHSDRPSSVMYPYYRVGASLSAGDIAGIQELYGTPAAPDAKGEPAPEAKARVPDIQLTILQPAELAVTTTASTMSFSGTASGGTGDWQITWRNDRGGAGRASGSGTWSVLALPLSTGTNVITFIAQDSTKNTATRNFTVTSQPKASGPDTTPPAIIITFPASTILATTASTLTVRGTASDSSGVTAVTWLNSAGGAGSASGTAYWVASEIPLRQGNNAITIRAFDAAGNNSWRSITVVRR